MYSEQQAAFRSSLFTSSLAVLFYTNSLYRGFSIHVAGLTLFTFAYFHMEIKKKINKSIYPGKPNLVYLKSCTPEERIAIEHKDDLLMKAMSMNKMYLEEKILSKLKVL